MAEEKEAPAREQFARDRAGEQMKKMVEREGREGLVATKTFWTKLQEERAKAVLDVVSDLKDYYPLTLRQIHYRLVEKQPWWYKSSVKNPEPYQNTTRNYQDLSKVLKWMRIDERLPREVMTDRIRRVSTKRGFEDLQTFVNKELSMKTRG